MDHDEKTCTNWLRCVQIEKDALGAEQPLESEKEKNEGASTYFLEYESDTERGGDVFMTL